jgi:hypothetical protein
VDTSGDDANRAALQSKNFTSPDEVRPFPDQRHVDLDSGPVGPGDAVHIPPGHDAWTVGDEACTVVDFGGLKGYAQPTAD